jgi:hypothetical protein
MEEKGTPRVGMESVDPWKTAKGEDIFLSIH